MVRPLFVRILKIRLLLMERFRSCELQVMLAWAGVVGLLGGLASVLFRKGIQVLHGLFTHHEGIPEQTASLLPIGQRLLIPTLGALGAGLVIHFGMRLIRGQVSKDYMEAITLGDGVIRTRSTLVKSLSSLLTIASGSSIGREGPMVQLSAMLASLLGRQARFSTPRLKLMVACGAAAGIASAYNAPIAGALFVAEIVLGSIAMESFGPLIFSSVIATVTTRHLLGSSPVFEIPSFHLVSNWELLPYLLLGLITGFAAPWFLRLLEGSERLFAAGKLPFFLRMGLGGLVVGILSIREPRIWGNGYGVVDSILHHEWMWQALLGILVLKLLATAASVGSGAVGGVFTPTLFMGAVLGSLWGHLIHFLWPQSTAPSSAYGLVGMAGFLAGTTHAPLMAILIIFEMTLDYAIVGPLMLACVTAYYTSRSIEPRSIYADSLLRKEADQPVSPIAQLRVRDLMKPNPLRVTEKAPFSEIAGTFVKNRMNYLYVVDGKDRLCGALSLHDIKPYLNTPELAHLVRAYDLVREGFPSVVSNATLPQVMEAFVHHDGERLPVIRDENDRTLLGTVSKRDLLFTLAHGSKAHEAGATASPPSR